MFNLMNWWVGFMRFSPIAFDLLAFLITNSFPFLCFKLIYCAAIIINRRFVHLGIDFCQMGSMDLEVTLRAINAHVLYPIPLIF